VDFVVTLRRESQKKKFGECEVRDCDQPNGGQNIGLKRKGSENKRGESSILPEKKNLAEGGGVSGRKKPCKNPKKPRTSKHERPERCGRSGRIEEREPKSGPQWDYTRRTTEHPKRTKGDGGRLSF